MSGLDALNLHYLPMEEPGFAADPFPHFAAARAVHPWLARCAFGHVITSYDAMRDLLWLDHSLTGAYDSVAEIMQARGTEWGRFQSESLLAQTGDAHKRIRSVLAPAFTPQQATRHRPLMRKVIGELLDQWAPRAEFDFEDFASMFPITVMASLIGADPAVIPDIKDSLEALGLSMSMDPAILPRLEAATLKLDAFVQDLVASRRANPLPDGKEDLLTVLVRTHDEGKVNERELHDLLIFLFVAGYDTSKNALTLLMDVMIQRPDIYRRCATDLPYCGKVVEENFRYLTTSTIPRMVTKDIAYQGVTIPAGSSLFFPVSISGRDPALAQADTFEPEFPRERKHITFGMGVHICMGQFIARAQIEEGLHLIAQRMRNPRRVGPSAWRPFFGVWGLKGLPIAFDPAPAIELEPA